MFDQEVNDLFEGINSGFFAAENGQSRKSNAEITSVIGGQTCIVVT